MSKQTKHVPLSEIQSLCPTEFRESVQHIIDEFQLFLPEHELSELTVKISESPTATFSFSRKAVETDLLLEASEKLNEDIRSLRELVEEGDDG